MSSESEPPFLYFVRDAETGEEIQHEIKSFVGYVWKNKTTQSNRLENYSATFTHKFWQREWSSPRAVNAPTALSQLGLIKIPHKSKSSVVISIRREKFVELKA